MVAGSMCSCGGACVVVGGACMVVGVCVWLRGVHGCRGHAWLPGACMVARGCA